MKADNIPRVAVLLAAYNGMQWIEEQVDSILNQQGVAVTLFLVWICRLMVQTGGCKS